MNGAVAGIAAAIVVLGGLGLALGLPRLAHDGGTPSIGGPFALVDGAGHGVTDKDLLGHWTLIYFGYTHCPDACPTTLSAIGGALDKMSPAARKAIKVLFITVDPARDSAAVVGAYAKAFGPEFVGLGGSAPELAKVAQEFRVYAQRHDLKGGDYAMDHSSIIYVMGPDGRFAGLLDDSLSPGDMAERLTHLGA
jgi:cytochrome oxidase Cu insertion factor (SCO1/SenC/PrrC family)